MIGTELEDTCGCKFLRRTYLASLHSYPKRPCNPTEHCLSGVAHHRGLRPLKQSLHIPWRGAIHSSATTYLRTAEIVGPISIEPREQSYLGTTFSDGVRVAQSRPQTWYASYTKPPHHPFRKSRSERGGGKWSRLSYNGNVGT